MKASFVFSCIFAGLSQSFYLPGVAPKDYSKDSPVPLLVNALTAKDSLLPYDYYHPGFAFCTPEKSVSQRESLGSILFGDRLFNSPFKVSSRARRCY
jgi:transmembrane 9 superfamily protein 2/4